MSMISKKGVYGLSAMYVLALNTQDTLMHSKDIAKKANIPHNFLEQILIILKKEKLVRSIRGNKGGYRLARSKEQIIVYDILDALESCISCVSIDDEKETLLDLFWLESQDKVKEIFNISLDELIHKNKKNIIFYI
jgi:Rrf2 family cysteine metabolism transcriptional repressor